MIGAQPAPEYWDGAGLAKLLTAVFIGPAAWGLNLQINYSLVKWACASEQVGVLMLVSALAFAAAAAGAAIAWQCRVRLRDDGNVRGGRVVDRSYFLALSGLGLSVVSGVLILLGVVLQSMVSPCE